MLFNNTALLDRKINKEVEMLDHVGAENIFIFDNTTPQVEVLRSNGYNSRLCYEQNAELHQVLTQIATGLFSPQEPGR
ncbi:Glycogen phosphorylase, fragment [Erwinia pyrifoliae Ep1/96]|nr:Glycogen phosphorylase, fragment [Erwinia pyrifoliae Ep1/96]